MPARQVVLLTPSESSASTQLVFRQLFPKWFDPARCLEGNMPASLSRPRLSRPLLRPPTLQLFDLPMVFSLPTFGRADVQTFRRGDVPTFRRSVALAFSSPMYSICP